MQARQSEIKSSVSKLLESAAVMKADPFTYSEGDLNAAIENTIQSLHIADKAQTYNVVKNLITTNKKTKDVGDLSSEVINALSFGDDAVQLTLKDLENAADFSKKEQMIMVSEAYEISSSIVKNDDATEIAEKIEDFHAKYGKPSLDSKIAKAAIAFAVAAAVTVAGAVIGALVGAAATSWSGPGAAIGAFIGALKGASIGWAHGVAAGALVAGGAAYAGTNFSLGFFGFGKNEHQDQVEAFVEASKNKIA